MIKDPLNNIRIDILSYDIARQSSVYDDRSGTRWWTKAWFNGREKPERAVEINCQLVWDYQHGKFTLDAWLSRFFPKQMSCYQQAITEARKQLLGI